jgi:hypothetical protein
MPPNSNGQTIPLRDNPDRLDRPKVVPLKRFATPHASFIFADFFDFHAVSNSLLNTAKRILISFRAETKGGK